MLRIKLALIDRRFVLYEHPASIAFGFYRAMLYSAKRGLAIACRLSVYPSVALVDQNHIG